ncbi:MAG: ABC transporter ATP-binding protein [Lachnospiraceae bacterium]|nr:ABC transporter ATP-binding protein [Lachnospiraceae bacterium]
MPPMMFRSRQFLTEEEKKNAPKISAALLRRIGSYLIPYWRQFLLCLLTVILSSVLALLPSILTGRIIDDGLIGRNLGSLITLTLLSLGVMLAANLIAILEDYLNTWIAQHITYDMRRTMYAHLQKMPHSFFTTHNQGDIISRMTGDIDGVQAVFTNTLASILTNIITLIAAVVLMLRQSVPMALIGILIIPLFILPTRSAGKARWTLTRQSRELSDEMNGILNETMSVSGQLLVKLFGREAYEYDRFDAVNRRMIRVNLRERLAGRWFRMALHTFSNIGPMLIYLAGGILLIRYDASLTVGDITVLVALLSKMYTPVNQLLNIQVDVVRSMALFTRLFSYFDMIPAIDDPPCPVIPAEPASGAVTFDHVSFSYNGTQPVLSDISFSLEPGRSVAVVGPSGAGKSTLVNLIPRLYDVTEGAVLFDGHDVRSLSLEYLRSRIGIVSQDTYLFNGTIRDNLLYARPDASEDDLIEACRRANIYDFILSREEGFDTVVGNRGLKLSGGEKQRLSIARVLLKDPALMIFDEATSSLDSISEQKIQEAIEPLIASRSAILIAHRLSTILAADEILVISGGHIVERGTHDSLVGAGGVYTTLYETQFKKAMEKAADLTKHTE